MSQLTDGRKLRTCLLSGVACFFATAALGADLFDPSPLAKGPVGVVDRSRPAYDAIGYRYGSFLFLPTLLTSATFDDNIFATRTARVSDLVFHVVPSVAVKADLGQTQLNGSVTADGRISTQRSSMNSLSPGVGLGFKTFVQRDLTIQGRADYAYRAEDPSDTNLLGGGAGTVLDLVRYHDFTSNFSVNKSFDRFFVSAGAAYQHLAYEDATDVLGLRVRESLRDADLATLTLRAGYEVGPGLKVFAEPSYNLRRYTASAFDSDGFRVVGGLSSALGGLVTGEVYVGYMQQDYKGAVGTVSGFTTGANLRWFPTDLVTVTLKADRTIKDTGITAGINLGSPAIVTSVNLQADYELWRNLVLSGRLGVQNYDYQRNSNRKDYLYTAGVTATYLFSRLISGSLDYKYMVNDSNASFNNYTRNQVTLSLSV